MPQPILTPTFTLLGVPVRVASSFWIIALLFGMRGGDNAVGALRNALIWTAVVFVSIVLHELGHALTARRFGAKPVITLHAMGGLTHFEGVRMSRARTVLISFAGPATGLAVGIAVWLLASPRTLSPPMQDLVAAILWANIGWSLINLLPVVPFDGGHILEAILGPRRALSTAVISAVVGSAAAAAGLVLLKSLLAAFFFGSATVGAVRQARRLWLSERERKDGFGSDLEKVHAAMARGDASSVLSMAGSVVERARTPATKNAGLLALAWAHATLGRVAVAREIVEKLERDVPPDPYLFAALEDALGAPERARALLEAARQQQWKSANMTKLLIDLYARDGQMSRAADLATEDLELLGHDDARAVMSAAMAQGTHRAAAGLARRMFERWSDPADGLDEARASALAGDAAQALALLERLIRGDEAGGAPLATLDSDTLRNDAAFKSLRGQERFEQLLEPRPRHTLV